MFDDEAKEMTDPFLAAQQTGRDEQASHEQKERMEAPSEGLERRTSRFQLNGTTLEGPACHWKGESRFTAEVWRLLFKSQLDNEFIDFNTRAIPCLEVKSVHWI